MDKSDSYETHHITWDGIEIEIRFARDWLGSAKSPFPTAHLEVEAVNPPRAVLPITDTGFRSHFLTAENVDVVGGAVAYVIEALNLAAKHPAWKKRRAAQKQLSLF